MVEDHRLLAALDERLVEDVESLQERSVGRCLYVIVSHESALCLRVGLTPHLQIDFHYVFFHCNVYE